MSPHRRLRKRAGRDPGAEKLAEHMRVEQLFAGRAEDCGGAVAGWGVPLGEETNVGVYSAVPSTAHERDEQGALGE